jgi:hypothetical protein
MSGSTSAGVLRPTIQPNPCSFLETQRSKSATAASHSDRPIRWMWRSDSPPDPEAKHTEPCWHRCRSPSPKGATDAERRPSLPRHRVPAPHRRASQMALAGLYGPRRCAGRPCAPALGERGRAARAALHNRAGRVGASMKSRPAGAARPTRPIKRCGRLPAAWHVARGLKNLGKI